MARHIYLNRGFKTLVDDKDYEVLSKFNWKVYKANGGYYRVSTWIKINNKWKSLEMPRAIMFPDRFHVVDHINKNTLDNRRYNLRICTHAENIRNQKLHKNHSTGLKGVYFNGSKWVLRGITVNGTRKYLGSFSCPLIAKIVHDKELIRLHKDFACFD